MSVLSRYAGVNRCVSRVCLMMPPRVFRAVPACVHLFLHSHFVIHDDKDRRETTWLSNLFGAAGGLWDLVGEPPKVCRLGEWESSCGEHMDLMPGALGAGGGVRTSAPSGSLCVRESAPRGD